MNDVSRRHETGTHLSPSEVRKPRVAVLVSNPCNPDYRVIKQAEFLASQGYNVQIFCTQAKDVPSFETFNGVSYRRIRWKIGETLSRLLGFARPDPLDDIRRRRAKFMKNHRNFFGNHNDKQL